MRKSFKLFVSIEKELSDVDNFLQPAPKYPIDNVIQIKLSKQYFTDLFRDTSMNTSQNLFESRYNSDSLLIRIEDFFDLTKYNNYNNLASDITNIVKNTFNDVDINPVSLETACAKNGTIFNYFFKSLSVFNGNYVPYENTSADQYGNNLTGDSIMVYEHIAREIDNMISRNLVSTSEDTTNIDGTSTSINPDVNYDDLDQLYTIYENSFWENLTIGDSIFIEGSFQVPTSRPSPVYSQYSSVGTGNIPIILQFVYSDKVSYGYQIPPLLILNGSSTVTWDITNGEYISGDVIAENYMGTNIIDIMVTTSNIPSNLSQIILGQSYTINYSLTSDGYTIQKSRNVVFEDSTGPTITIVDSGVANSYILDLVSSTKSVSYNGIISGNSSSYTFPTATSHDVYDNDIMSLNSANVSISPLWYSSSPYNSVLTNGFNGEISYVVSDTNGNQESVKVYIYLKNNIKLNGSTTVAVEEGSYVDPGYSTFYNSTSTLSIEVDSTTYTTIAELETYINSLTGDQNKVVNYSINSTSTGHQEVSKQFSRTIQILQSLV